MYVRTMGKKREKSQVMYVRGKKRNTSRNYAPWGKKENLTCVHTIGKKNFRYCLLKKRYICTIKKLLKRYCLLEKNYIYMYASKKKSYKT